MHVAAVIFKYKARIKDLSPLEDKHLLLASASTLKIGVPDLKRRVESLSVLPCKPPSLSQHLSYQVVIPWHSSCQSGFLHALTAAHYVSQT